MKDRLTKAERSWNMSRIKGKNTKPEIIVRSILHRMGWGRPFRLHAREFLDPRKKNRRGRLAFLREIPLDAIHSQYLIGELGMRGKPGVDSLMRFVIPRF